MARLSGTAMGLLLLIGVTIAWSTAASAQVAGIILRTFVEEGGLAALERGAVEERLGLAEARTARPGRYGGAQVRVTNNKFEFSPQITWPATSPANASGPGENANSDYVPPGFHVIHAWGADGTQPTANYVPPSFHIIHRSNRGAVDSGGSNNTLTPAQDEFLQSLYEGGSSNESISSAGRAAPNEGCPSEETKTLSREQMSFLKSVYK